MRAVLERRAGVADVLHRDIVHQVPTVRIVQIQLLAIDRQTRPDA
jgi:hypothetical protein